MTAITRAKEPKGQKAPILSGDTKSYIMYAFVIIAAAMVLIGPSATFIYSPILLSSSLLNYSWTAITETNSMKRKNKDKMNLNYGAIGAFSFPFITLNLPHLIGGVESCVESLGKKIVEKL
jgi:hypothetical protein